MSGMSWYDLRQEIKRGPSALLSDIQSMGEAALEDSDQPKFQDSDGLISFVNMSSSLVANNSEYQTGREICDKISNFFATLRIKVFGFLQNNPAKVLPGDKLPTSQWDPAVTHYMQFMLTQAGGLTNYRVTTETYSVTQLIAEFSTDVVKLIFDAAAAPQAIVADVLKFIQGVGKTLRMSWDDQSRNYAIALLGQCHEAVPIDGTSDTVVYFPKIKYYYISVDSSQQVFTTPCSKAEKVTFNFKYESYVTGLKASVLNPKSQDYAKFVKFLDKAQGISYKEAENNLDEILEGTVSNKPSSPSAFTSDANAFGVAFEAYPRASSTQAKLIELVLNQRG